MEQGTTEFIKEFKQHFEPGLIRELEENGNLLTAKSGDVVLDFGQLIRSIPILLSGSVKISRMDDEGKELFLYYVNPKEGCAMTFSCCMEQHPSEIRAVAEEDITYWTIPVDVMDRWMMTYLTWKTFVMRTIRARFQEMLRAIDQLAFQKLDERLVVYLKDRAKQNDSMLINLSHEQIATDLATSRVVISRLLKRLEMDGKLLLYRNQIKLLKGL
jgi:CRP/FNR family transcriptional regulator, anaerobic regulatory protein